MADTSPQTSDPQITALFGIGAHFGYRRSKRHPSVIPFIFGSKEGVEIFDLEKTKDKLATAEAFVKGLGAAGKVILFVGGKNEAQEAVASGAQRIGMPYVAGRWIGGTLTNFGQIRDRVEKMLDLSQKREKGELAKYTKKERLLIDREIARLEGFFAGIVPLKATPAALFAVDSGREYTAVTEAKKQNIPVIALSSSDCDLSVVDYAIPANDASRASIQFFVNKIADAYEAGRNLQAK